MFLPILLMAGLADDSPRGYVCPRAPGPIVVDGKLEDDGWKGVPWSADFVDIEGDQKPRPRFRTRVKMAWDDRYIYIAARLDEPHIWANLTEHDSVIFQDNDFEVFIDPDGDTHEYYEIEINSRNTEWDLFLDKPYRAGGPARNEWEIPGLLKAIGIDGTLNDPKDTDRSWDVELAIPWDVLGKHANRPSPPKDGDQWRINFSRVEWETTIEDGQYKKVPGKPEDNWVWSPQGVVDMHRPSRWGYVQFSTEAPGQAAFRPDPDGPTRDRLIALFDAQLAFSKEHGNWAKRLEDLKLESPTEGITLTARPDGYEATLQGPRKTWRIRQDSKLTPE
ncbi:MAG: carbohydrate-binding family 9-like protein [Isosphaeraceae bacterium]